MFITLFSSFFFFALVMRIGSIRFEDTSSPQQNFDNNHVLKLMLGNALVTNLGEVAIVTIDTREPAWTALKGYSDHEILNVGAGAGWENLGSKIVILADYLNETQTENPDQLLVFIDGADVIYGGCPANKLAEIFYETVGSGGIGDSKPKVVLGAEMGAFPSRLMTRYRIFDDRRKNTVKGRWNKLDYRDFADCNRTSAVLGPCSDPPFYQFGNTGFIMGTTRDILHVLSATIGYSNDQEGLIEYMLMHPEQVTLDYTGQLVLALHSLKDSVLDVEKDAETNATRLRNRVTGKIQCFVHGSGNGKRRLKEIATIFGRAILNETSTTKG